MPESYSRECRSSKKQNKPNSQENYFNPNIKLMNTDSTNTNGSSSTEEIDGPNNNRSTKSKKSLLAYVNEFVNQQNIFRWFTHQFDRSTGADHFKNSVVHSTFPINLNKNDFEYYVDMTFDDFPSKLTTKMKDLYDQTDENPMSEEIIIDDCSNGAISATLVQILSQKNCRNELEMLVGAVSVTRYPPQDRSFNRNYWKQHQEQIKKALQYLYGEEARKTLSLQN